MRNWPSFSVVLLAIVLAGVILSCSDVPTAPQTGLALHSNFDCYQLMAQTKLAPTVGRQGVNPSQLRARLDYVSIEPWAVDGWISAGCGGSSPASWYSGPCPQCRALNLGQQYQVDEAITALINNQNPLCQDAGNQLRIKSSLGAITYDPYTTYFGYMNPTGDPNIYLGDLAFRPGETANTISHEQSHFWGYVDVGPGQSGPGNFGDPYSSAYYVGDTCTGP